MNCSLWSASCVQSLGVSLIRQWMAPSYHWISIWHFTRRIMSPLMAINMICHKCGNLCAKCPLSPHRSAICDLKQTCNICAQFIDCSSHLYLPLERLYTLANYCAICTFETPFGLLHLCHLIHLRVYLFSLNLALHSVCAQMYLGDFLNVRQGQKVKIKTNLWLFLLEVLEDYDREYLIVCRN